MIDFLLIKNTNFKIQRSVVIIYKNIFKLFQIDHNTYK